MQTTTAFISTHFQGESRMVLIRAFFVLSTAVLLSGCASQSKTADQLRDNVQRNATFSSREVFEVKKPYRQVSDTLRKKWLECLDSTTTGSFHRGGNTFGTLTNIYKPKVAVTRSEEHTSELQSQSNLVCRLLLEKKKKETQ